MAEEICQNYKSLIKGYKREVMVENVLPNMIVVSLENGPKCYRGALFESNKENLSYGINWTRQAMIARVNHDKSRALVTVKPEAPTDTNNGGKLGASSLSSLCNRYSYAQDQEAVDPSLVAQQRPTFSRPLINKSINRMRLRARQIVCSNCKKGIHDNKRSASSRGAKQEELKEVAHVKNEKYSSKSSVQNKLNASTNESKKRKQCFEGVSSEASYDRKKLKFSGKTQDDKYSDISSVKKNTNFLKSSPAIKISFASPKGVGTVLKIPPRPSTPNPDDSDFSQDNAECPHDSYILKTKNEKGSKRPKTKKTSPKEAVDSSKRSKHSKHKSKKKSKLDNEKLIVPNPKITSSRKGLVGYRFVARRSSSPLKSPKELSPESMKCKVVLEKLDSDLTRRGYKNVKEQNSKLTESKSCSSINAITQDDKSNSVPVKSDMEKTRLTDESVDMKSRQVTEDSSHPVQNRESSSTSKCDYQQYFEDISDSDSNPLQVDLGEDEDVTLYCTSRDNSSRPGETEEENDENTEPLQPLKIHIQTRQLAKCQLSDGRVFRVGDVIWGKIVGFPWWPGRINLLLESFKNYGTVIAQTAHINWFGASTMSVVNSADLYPFLEYYKEKFTKKKKGSYRLAIKQATQVAESLRTTFKVLDNQSNVDMDSSVPDLKSPCESEANSVSQLSADEEEPVPESAPTLSRVTPVRFSDISSCDSQDSTIVPGEIPPPPDLINAMPVEDPPNLLDTLPTDVPHFSGPETDDLDFEPSGEINLLDDMIEQGLISGVDNDPLQENVGSALNNTSPVDTNSRDSVNNLDFTSHNNAYNLMSNSRTPEVQNIGPEIQKVPFDNYSMANQLMIPKLYSSTNTHANYHEKLTNNIPPQDERVFEAISDLEDGEIVDSAEES